MRLIKPSVEIIPQAPRLEGIYKQIEIAGRTCYKSEDRITEDSAKEFVDRMIKLGHWAMLEQGTVYLTIPCSASKTTLIGTLECDEYIYEHYLHNQYSRVRHTEAKGDRTYHITTNLRVLVENGWLDDLKYLCEPTEYHERRITAKFICDRGVSHEFVRHREFSFAQESTRYCDYSKDKFDNELTFIIPCWSNLPEGKYGWCFHENDFMFDGRYMSYQEQDALEVSNDKNFIKLLQYAESGYKKLKDINSWKPQQARAILPNALKTELVMTGFLLDWGHFFELRCSKAAHPDAKVLADQLREQFKEKRWIIE